MITEKQERIAGYEGYGYNATSSFCISVWRSVSLTMDLVTVEQSTKTRPWKTLLKTLLISFPPDSKDENEAGLAFETSVLTNFITEICTLDCHE